MPKKKDNVASGSAIAGVGAVTAGTGLVAGGVPGGKSDFSSIYRTKPGSGKGVKRAVTSVTGKTPAVKAIPGGILGFRHSAHKGGTAYFRGMKRASAKDASKSAADAFWHGRNAGKIKPEIEIMRNMRKGKKVAGAAVIGGTAATVYGVKRATTEVKKSQRNSDKYHGAVLGAGTAGAAISHGSSKVLSGQQRKWATRASDSVDEAGKLIPGIAGREGQKLNLRQMNKYKTQNPGKPWPKTMYPKVTDRDIKRNPKIFSGVNPKVAQKAGHLRGAAAQQRHFAEVYGNTAKVVRRLRTPSLVAAGVGAGGLVATRKKDKVRKSVNLSAFGVEH